MKKTFLGGLIGVLALIGCGDSDDPVTTAATTGTGGNTAGSGGNGGNGGSAPVADWSCVGSEAPPTYMAGTIMSTSTFVDALTMEPLEGITAKQCYQDDQDCANPFSEGVSDANGMLTQELDTSRRTYGEASGPGVVTSIGFGNGPATQPTGDTGLATPSVQNAIHAAAGSTVDATRGDLALIALDCGPNGAAGATFELDLADGSSTQVYAGASLLPDDSLTATDEAALGFILNVPVGAATATMFNADGELVGTRTLYIKAGAFSQVFISPVPEA